MTQVSREFRVRARGEIACFTRPEMKVERVSYEVMTPSAARGVLEAVLWKPAIAWRVHAIEVLAPVRWISFRRNEVNSKASDRTMRVIFADEDRAQRNTVALRDVDYVIHASFEMTRRLGPEDNVRKFEEMFERRLVKGQHHSAPFLGCREFAARVEPGESSPPPIKLNRPLGWMFFDFDWTSFEGHPDHSLDHKASEARMPLFFEARLTDGVVRVPPRESLRADSGAPQ
ncbi:MAG: type I-C CRISPR-associated protein Cas5 [Chloroflexi bacterium]|nr:type I-C CRISPR-associated protein Cas5 [Chloroflexota bacterium]